MTTLLDRLATVVRPASHRSTLSSCLGRTLAGLAAAATLAAAGPAPALTLRHGYAFDPDRIHIVNAQTRLHAPGLPSTWEAGLPEIPYDVVTLLVPRGARVVDVRARVDGETVLAEGVRLAPAAPIVNDAGQWSLPRTPRLTAAALGLAGPTGEGAAPAAAQASLYPAIAVEPAGGGALHGYQLLSLRLYPIRYDAAEGRVVAATRMEIEIDLAPGGALPLERERYSPAIEAGARAALERLVANPSAIDGYDRRIGRLVEWGAGAGAGVAAGAARHDLATGSSRQGFHPTDAPSLEGSPVDYVIVTSQAMASAWQVLADWKTQRGVPTVVRTIEWIEANYRHGSDLQETIRNFIRDAYVEWGVQYVLLAGDTDVIPARYGFSAFGEVSEQSIPTDMYFACLDGTWNYDGDGVFGEAAISVSNPGDSTDLYAEVFIGRATTSTPAAATAYVGKVMTYENPPWSIDDSLRVYQRKLLMLAEVLFPVDWEPGEPVTLDGGAFSQEMLAYVGACPDITRLYQYWQGYPGAEPLSKSRAIAEMNEGQGFVNHIGHGYRYSLSLGDGSITNSDALALTNGDRRFVLYMLNCTATAFDFPCLAEAFLEAQGGAVAVVGASRSAYAIPSRNYNREFFEALHQNGYVHIGQTFVQSRLPYTPNAYFDTSDHYSHFLYNFLGDPEMVVHTCSLSTTVATYPDTIALGTTNVAVHVEAGGVPQLGALVCLMKGAAGAEAYEWGTTNASGDVTIPFRAESAGTAAITVSGQNTTILEGSIHVVPSPGAYVHVASLLLDDDAADAYAGNGDGTLDAGETLEVDVTGVNDGPAAALGVTGVLRIASPWVTVADSTFTLGTIAASGGTATSVHECAFTVAAGTPDGTVLPLAFVTTDSVSTWTDVVNRVVHAPSVQLVLLDVDDPPPGGDGDGLIDAGETFDLIPHFKNYGTGAADSLLATLASSDPDVILVEDSIAVGRANPMQEVTGSTRFRLSEAVLDENSLVLAIGDSHGRSTSWAITLRGPAKPAKPALSTKSGAGVVTATWTPSPEADLAGYHVERALSGFGPWSRVTQDRLLEMAYYRDTGLAPSTKYYYRVTAIDQSGNESVPSDAANINTAPAELAGWPIQLGASSSCPVAVGDLDGDGASEITAGNDHLYAWHWNGIEVLDDDNDPLTWGIFSIEVNTVTGAVAMAEMDTGSPGLETFVTVWEDSNEAYTMRGDGSFPPGWPRSPDPGSSYKGYWGASSAVDVDADGRAELFAPAKNGNLYAWHWDGTPLGVSEAFKSGFSVLGRTSPSFANLDADPELEIVFGAPNGQLHIWNADGSNFPNFPVTAGTLCLSNTAVGDVNDDGTLDVVFLTEGGLVHVYNTATGTELAGWPESLSIKGNPISPSPALADFDGDGKLEIVVANNSLPITYASVRVYDWQSNVLPGWPRYTGGVSSESSPVVADVTGDGVPDVLFGNEGGFLYGWDRFGADLPGFPITIGDFVRSTPYVDDVDGDGYANIVLAGWDKNVHIWDLQAVWNPAAAHWPTLKRDVHRSGTFGFVFDIAPPSPPTSLASTSHAPGAWSGDPTVDVAWSGASDPSGIGGYSYEWDTSPSSIPDSILDTTGSPATSPALGEGQSHWFHLRTVDTLGHWTAGALHLGPFWIDVTPPGGVPSASADRPVATWSSDNTIDATWLAAVDPEAGMGVAGQGTPGVAAERIASALPDAAFLPPQTAGSGIGGYSIEWSTDSLTAPDATIETASLGATSPPLADGQAHWFHVRAVDAAGNAAEPDSTYHLGPFWVDATAPEDPTAFVTSPATNVWVQEDSIAVSWSGAADNLSGIAGYSVLFDGNATTVPDAVLDTTGGSAVLTPVPEGLTWFHLRTQDGAGNWTSTAHVGPFRIDTTPPAATVIAPNGGEVWAHNSVQTIRWQAADAASGVAALELRLSTDGGATFPVLVANPPAGDSTFAWTVPLSVTGTARIEVIATDAAGNTGQDASDANFALTTAVDVAASPPVVRTWLAPPAPNPFNPSTTLRYSLLETGRVRIVVHDARGRLVRTLVDGVQAGPRWYEIRWNGTDGGGRTLPSGVYIATLRAGRQDQSRRLLLVK